MLTGLLRKRHSRQAPILRVTLKDSWLLGLNFLLRFVWDIAPGTVSNTVTQSLKEVFPALASTISSPGVDCLFRISPFAALGPLSLEDGSDDWEAGL